jgi:hypothetical protein
MRSDRIITAVLSFLVLFDLLLVVWAFGFPELWFLIWHGSAEASPHAELLLKRVGANWAGFMVFQAVALKYWKTSPVWLAVIAGVRFSDVFTDITYAVFAQEATWFTYVALPPMGLINFALGWYLLSAYRDRAQS